MRAVAVAELVEGGLQGVAGTAESPSASVRSDLMVRKIGLSGRGWRIDVGGRQIDRDVDGRERRRDHEDDQQHQDDVDERRDVDVVDVAERILAVIEPDAHALTPQPEIAAG